VIFVLALLGVAGWLYLHQSVLNTQSATVSHDVVLSSQSTTTRAIVEQNQATETVLKKPIPTVPNQFTNKPTPDPLAKPFLQVIFPMGGEVIKIGSSFYVEWMSENLDSANMKIMLRVESKACPTDVAGFGCLDWDEYVIADGLKNTGSYLWDTSLKLSGSMGHESATLLLGTAYRIVICPDDDIENCRVSDSTFTFMD
jgi:hypothetical protein